MRDWRESFAGGKEETELTARDDRIVSSILVVVVDSVVGHSRDAGGSNLSSIGRGLSLPEHRAVEEMEPSNG